MPIDEVVKSGAIPSGMTPDAVQAQLRRVLESPLFSHSRRYPNFLSYVVDQALKGHGGDLKERTIGVEVFGRAVEYDLANDPVVRQTAGEVRKRLAQYYYEAERAAELRIELHPGSYVPEFKAARGESGATAAPPVVAATEESEPAAAIMSGPTSLVLEEPGRVFVEPHDADEVAGRAVALVPLRSSRDMPYRLLGVFACLVLLGVGVAGVAWRTRASMLDRLWEPVVKSSAPILISVGSWGEVANDSSQLSIRSHAKAADPVALADTVTAAAVQQLLSEHGRSTVIQASTQTSYSELQRGTVVLISAFDNEWTMRLLAPLRFHFVAHEGDVLSIEDRENPARTAWSLDTRVPYADLSRDYAIVARFHDPTTEQLVVVAAGIGENGTMAAGQMLSSEKLFQSSGLDSVRMADSRNMEAVVETQVIRGKNGPPRVVALTTW